MTSVIRADTDQLRAVARQMRATADGILAGSGAVAREMDSFAATWSGSARDRGMARWETIHPRYQPDAERLTSFARELDALADRLDEAARVFGGLVNALTPEQREHFAELRRDAEWRISQAPGGETLLHTGYGETINLTKLTQGDQAEFEKYLRFYTNQSALEEIKRRFAEARDAEAIEAAQDMMSTYLTVAEGILDGKWQHVSGYFNGQSGSWVDDYWRRLPGGEESAKAFRNAAGLFEVGSGFYSMYQGITNQEQPRWEALPIARQGDVDIVYNYYVEPTDHFRDAAGKFGGFLGGVGGGVLGGSIGSAPGGVLGAIGGGAAGEGVAEGIYDWVNPKDPPPPPPPSRFTPSQEGDTIGLDTNEDVKSVDVGRISSPDGAAGSLNCTYDANGRPVMTYTVSTAF